MRSRACSVLFCSFAAFTVAAAAPPPLHPGDDLGDTLRLSIGPVDGLTRGWHDAPATVPLPAGATAVLVLRKSMTGDTLWTNAVEIFDTFEVSVAMVLPGAGEVVVTAVVMGEDQPIGARSCTIVHTGVALEAISVGPIAIDAPDFTIDENSKNEEAVAAYFGDSIAQFELIGPDEYLTSVERRVYATTTVTPPQFATMVEWRLAGKGRALGVAWSPRFDDPGLNELTVGPPEVESLASVTTYRTTILQPPPGTSIPQNEPFDCVAVTDPPGYEERIQWLAATKFGTSNPIVGRGPKFTAHFTDTFGPAGDGRYWTWSGVKADNAVRGEDRKVEPFQDHFSSDTPGTFVHFGGGVIPPIPADFFYPGSEPFFGLVNFTGAPIFPGTAFTDTIVQRTSHVRFPGIGFPRPSDPIPIELVQLSLTSAQPITIAPLNEPWVFSLGLSQHQIPGQMSAVLQSPQGGTFSATLPVRPRFIFVRQQQLDDLDAGIITPDDLDFRILDFEELKLPPIVFQFVEQPFSTVLPSDGSYVAPCVPAPVGDESCFYPGVIPGGPTAGVMVPFAPPGVQHAVIVEPQEPPAAKKCEYKFRTVLDEGCNPGPCQGTAGQLYRSKIPCVGPADCPPWHVVAEKCKVAGECVYTAKFDACR